MAARCQYKLLLCETVVIPAPAVISSVWLCVAALLLTAACVSTGNRPTWRPPQRYSLQPAVSEPGSACIQARAAFDLGAFI
ncbi:uncharacterized [Tachysurus ichikawai]